jgi:putative glycosyltransferase
VEKHLINSPHLMQLSIVATLYGSATYLSEFYKRVCAAADHLSLSYEIVMVNDGSPDASLDVAVRMAAADRRVRVVDLSRRYGHYEAILAGIRQTSGDNVFVIDSDLDEPPELLEILWRELGEHPECDLIVACQSQRRLRSIADIGGSLYYRVLRAQTGLDIPRDNLVARLMTRRYAGALLSMRERPVSFDALSARAGFRHRAIPAVKAIRRGTTYSFARRATLFVDSMLAYGSRAAHVFALAAIVLAVAGLWSFFMWPQALQVILILASCMLMAGVATLCRYLDLLLEEIRHTPATIRRIYPDA